LTEKIVKAILEYKAAIVFALLILIIGSIALISSMPAGVFPNATFPRILVQVERAYAPLTEMEITTTKPLEDALRNVEGVRIVRSKTSRGYAEIELYFDWNIDLMQAYQLVQARISDVRSKLPPGAAILVKRMTTSAYPISCYAIYSDFRSQKQLRNLAEFTIRPLLSRVKGVFRIEIVGGEQPEFWIVLNPDKLALYKISPIEIDKLLRSLNKVKFLGKITDKYHIHLGFQNDLLKNAGDIKNVVIAQKNGIPIKIKDIAGVNLTSKEEYIITTANWHRAVLIDVLKQPNANGLSVENKIDKIISRFKKDLPIDIHLEKTYDQEEFVKSSIVGVTENIIAGILIISLIVLFFLKSFRASWPIILFMPVVIIFSFFLMNIFGLSINIMTLGGIAAAIGILVDNATVVVENIIRRSRETNNLSNLIVLAVAEVLPPMFGATITTVIVFVPLIFVTGLTGIFFKPLALTIAIAVFLSLLLAVIITPISVNYFFGKRSKFQEELKFLKVIKNFYEKTLRYLLNNKLPALILLAAIIVLSALLYPALRTGFLPEWDEGAFVINYKAPPGTSLNETNKILFRFEKIMKQTPEIKAYSRRTGRGIAHRHPANEGDFLVSLKKNRTRSTEEIMSWLNRRASEKIPGLFLDFVQVLPDRLSDLAGEEKPIDILIFGNDNSVVQKTAFEIYSKLKKVKGLVGLAPAEFPSEPEFDILLHHEKAAQLGFKAGSVQKLIETAIWGKVSTYIKQGMRLVGVRLRYPKFYRKNFDALKQLQILSPTGEMVPINQIAKIKISEGKASILHENGSLVAKVLADISGRDLGSVVKDVKNILSKVKLPYGVSVYLGGDYASRLKSFKQLFFVLLLSSLLVLVVLLFEFNRFRTSFAIFLGTISSFSFVIFGLYVTKVNFDISSFIGTITVLGIVVNNGILLMDFTTRYRRNGKSKKEAVLIAGRLRLRPILITNTTTIAGFLPLALQLGSGGEILQPFAVAVISGLLGSMFFSLIVIPLLYDLFEK